MNATVSVPLSPGLNAGLLSGSIYADDINPSSELIKDETVGPVASIIKIKNIDDAINYISND